MLRADLDAALATMTPPERLVTQMPDLRDEMIEIWNRYARETGVILPDENVFLPHPRPASEARRRSR